MREHKQVLVVTFSATADAMAMEKYCKEHNIPGRLIPTPQEISSGCGLAWKTLPEEEYRFSLMKMKADICWENMMTIEMWG